VLGQTDVDVQIMNHHTRTDFESYLLDTKGDQLRLSISVCMSGVKIMALEGLLLREMISETWTLPFVIHFNHGWMVDSYKAHYSLSPRLDNVKSMKYRDQNDK
jgi:hypothetical protein